MMVALPHLLSFSVLDRVENPTFHCLFTSRRLAVEGAFNFHLLFAHLPCRKAQATSLSADKDRLAPAEFSNHHQILLPIVGSGWYICVIQ